MKTPSLMRAAASALALAAALAAGSASAMDLREAVQIAINSNPQINQAIQNREAIEYERQQASGLYQPRVTLEASAGARRLDNPSRRSLGIEEDTLSPVEVGVVAEQVLFDFGRREGELERQASRVDGASHRVLERSEFIALEVSREFINYDLQRRIYAAALENIQFHEQMVSDLGEGVNSGSISIADRQQAEERLHAARARLTEAREDMIAAAIAFMTRTGLSIDEISGAPSLSGNVPPSIEEAVGLARTNNPRVKMAMADIDAAHALIKSARSGNLPRIALEGRARTGEDIDGFEDETTDLQVRLTMRWTVFDGGITSADVQEQVRRASEERYRLHQVVREVEEDVKSSWNRRENQRELGSVLGQQAAVSDDLLTSYVEQFRVGRRSLLDVLDAQNTRYNSKVLAETARASQMFAEYRVLAATGTLLSALGVQAPPRANAYARQRFGVEETPPAELNERRTPDR
jgi:adhesin transport system outer membrane protein